MGRQVREVDARVALGRRAAVGEGVVDAETVEDRAGERVAPDRHPRLAPDRHDRGAPVGVGHPGQVGPRLLRALEPGRALQAARGEHPVEARERAVDGADVGDVDGQAGLAQGRQIGGPVLLLVGDDEVGRQGDDRLDVGVLRAADARRGSGARVVETERVGAPVGDPDEQAGLGHADRLGERGDEAHHAPDPGGHRHGGPQVVANGLAGRLLGHAPDGASAHRPTVRASPASPGTVRPSHFRRGTRWTAGRRASTPRGCSSSRRPTGWSCTGCCSATAPWISTRSARGCRSAGWRSIPASGSARPGRPGPSASSAGWTRPRTWRRTSRRRRWTSRATTPRWRAAWAS